MLRTISGGFNIIIDMMYNFQIFGQDHQTLFRKRVQPRKRILDACLSYQSLQKCL